MNWNALLYGTLAALLALFFMYLDSKLLDNPKTRATYVKGMLMSGIIVWILSTFLGSSRGGVLSDATQYLPGLNEEIITGPPTF